MKQVMMQQELIEMAQMAGFVTDGLYICTDHKEGIISQEALALFADLVVAKEREACAKVCEDMDEMSYPTRVIFPSECAAAIRAR